MGLRDHNPFVIESFNGLWDRGDDESCPADHFLVADNIQYFESGVETRNPLNKWQQTTGIPLTKIQRIHSYIMQDGQSLLVLTQGGKIYHLVGPSIIRGPILTIPAMTDFNIVSIAGNAYITPFHTLSDTTGQKYEIGIEGEFIYVYHGDGNPARKAGGVAPTNGGLKSFIAYNDTNTGAVVKGIHLLTVMFNDDVYTPNVVQVVDAPGNLKIQLANIPVSPFGPLRTIAMTKAIDPKDYTATGGYTYYKALTIPDNSTTNLILDVLDTALTEVVHPSSPYPNDAMMVGQSELPGFCDRGLHIVGVVYETKSGYLTAPGPEFFAMNTYVDTKRALRVFNIPRTADLTVEKRHLISTKAIFGYNGDQKGYQFYFIPDGTINDSNSSTFKENISYFDSDLVDDASHLLDNYDFIPAGVNLTTYHGRMVVVGLGSTPEASPHDHIRPDNRSVALLSAPGEPEAISKVDGLIIVPLDGFPLTNAQEFRNILYLYKRTHTYAYADNFDVPSTWTEEVLDQGIGAPVHGIGKVLDTGGVNTDFLIIVDWSGLILFNGTYARPELTFKIEDFWAILDRNDFRNLQIANDSIGKKLYITMPEPFRQFVLYADYGNGLDAKNIRWSKWIFDGKVTTVCLTETNKLILGIDGALL